MTNVLDTIKIMLGKEPDDTDYDLDILINMNQPMEILRDLGIPILIDVIDENSKWDDVVDAKYQNNIKSYLFFNCKKFFDTPNSGVIKVFDSMINQIEFRLRKQAENEEV